MVRRNKNPRQKYYITLLMIVLAALVFFGSQLSIGGGLDLERDTVYLPVFTSTECTVIAPDYTETYDYASRQDSNGWITEYCSRNDHEVYTNRCELELTRNEQGFFDSDALVTDFYVCPVGTSFEDRNTECREINGQFGTFSYNADEFVLARMRDGVLGFGEVERDEVTIKKVANWYGLKTIDSNNYLSKEVTCDIGRIQDKGFTFLNTDAQEDAPNGVLDFNQVMNYVSAVSPAISKSVIQYNGQIVYTNGNQIAYPVETDPEGLRFVNLNKQINAPDLICNPVSPFCSDDGTEIINIDSTGGENGGKTCSELYGSFLDQYIPNPNNPSQVCQTTCTSDNTLKPHSCKTIPQCDEGILNENYECVTANVPQDGEESTFDATIFIIIGVFAVIILTMVAVKLRQNKGGKR